MSIYAIEIETKFENEATEMNQNFKNVWDEHPNVWYMEHFGKGRKERYDNHCQRAYNELKQSMISAFREGQTQAEKRLPPYEYEPGAIDCGIALFRERTAPHVTTTIRPLTGDNDVDVEVKLKFNANHFEPDP